MTTRRKARDTAGGQPEKEPKRAKVKRSREWDKKHNPGVATYRIGDELKQEIRGLAAELGVSTAAIVKAFLTHGLEEHKAGEIDVHDQG